MTGSKTTDPLNGGLICFVGCGKMGEAMLRGWTSDGNFKARELYPHLFDVVVPHAERAQFLESRYGIQESLSSASETPADVAMVILAVKPQVMDEVLAELASSPAFAEGQPLVVSIAAGVTCAHIESALPATTHVVRTMPNMPLEQCCGATVVAKGSHATDAEAKFVNDLFATLGVSFMVEESHIDAACALSGGGPAYFAFLAECLAKAGEQAGLEGELARALARQTLAGTGVCLAEGDASLAELRQSVCSPGGTTLAALDAMEGEHLPDAVTCGVAAAIKRAKELSQC